MAICCSARAVTKGILGLPGGVYAQHPDWTEVASCWRVREILEEQYSALGDYVYFLLARFVV